MTIVTRRMMMSLYSDHDDVYSHQVRIVLAEKGVTAEIFPSKHQEASDDLLNINPYGTLPTLLDRDLVLYEARIIMEYLDERFPHPPLLPVYPVARAEVRKMMFRIEKDWYCLLNNIKAHIDVESSRHHLLESLINLEPIFNEKPYFLSSEFSLLDCVLAPLLWRLPQLDIDLPPSKAKSLHAYMQRVFERDSFQTSLSDVEKQVRAA